MKNILFFQYPWRLWRTRLAGIYRYAAKAGWHVQVIDRGQMAPSVKKTLAFWRPDGCLVEGRHLEHRGFRAEEFGDLPTVWFDANRANCAVPLVGVEQDATAAVTLAAEELRGTGVAHYAYVGNIRRRTWWSDLRQSVMAAAAARAGATFHVFAAPRLDSLRAYMERLRPWLAALPKPCGVLAANDIAGDFVLQACRMECLKVPEELAVIGIDNDELLCEHAAPTLTSVMPDFELSGHLAAELLDGLFAGRLAAPHTVTFGAAHVVRRASTAQFARRDFAVRRAFEFIRRHACDGITAADVCREMGGSRRRAEIRFRDDTAQSIGEAIRRARIARAKDLLLRRTAPLDTLFADCGYRDAAALRKAFRKTEGRSMRAYLASHTARK